ncbi:PKD-like family lipoprotein [Chitinophaga vietnamensis]|uniref:PKD-like family lipoprotein n=1 Tax=Chitinophaga vietnamensis TaxID=2593957 RepID=UPI0011786360|nr:PKD-like family lipoprotein [Chitinophaga vietnamensis]
MKRTIKNILLLASGSASLLFSSCYKDLGNYAYKDVNKVVIDTFPSSIFVYQFDTLRLTPKISATLDSSILNDTARFAYQWTIGGNGSSYVKGTILSYDRNLNARVTNAVGSYGLYFEMTDKKTGQVFTRYTSQLVIGSSTYEGWMVLCDVDGNTRLDMVNFVNGNTRFTRDILSLSPDLPKPLKGPRYIAYYATGRPNAAPPPYHNPAVSLVDREWIYLCTDKGSWKLRNDYLYTSGAWYTSKEFISRPDSATFLPGFVGANEGAASSDYVYVYDNKGNFYERDPYQWYVTNMNKVSGEGNFRAAPFLGRNYGMAFFYNSVLFDMDKKRFLLSTPGSSTCNIIPNPDSPLFDFSNTGMDLRWMRSVPGLDLTFAIMKDAAGDTWLLTFDVRSSVTQDRKVKLTGTDISKAEHFTVDKNYGTIYYSVGSKVYAMNKDFPGVCYQVLDAGNKKISWLDQHLFTVNKGYGPSRGGYVNGYTYNNPQGSGSLDNYPGSWLGVATYDPAQPTASNGTLTFYSPQDFLSQHAALVKKQEYSGFGKIVSVSYRER